MGLFVSVFTTLFSLITGQQVYFPQNIEIPIGNIMKKVAATKFIQKRRIMSATATRLFQKRWFISLPLSESRKLLVMIVYLFT